MKKLVLPLALALGLLLALAAGVIVSRAEPPAPLRTLNSGHHFLPPYPNPRDRFGFDSIANDPVTNYDVALLNAAWYTDWGTNHNPPHPDGLTYVQQISFKAGTTCSSLYTDPAQVKVSPSKASIAQIAADHPGSLWLMTNEPDSCYQGTPVAPDVYAHVYHEFYYYIKGLDPTALIANGGIVQPTPCRMMYLDIVWNTYQQAYGETMPVDVWNIHAFTLREVYNQWGASTPPGVPTSCAMNYSIPDSLDVDILRQNLIAFRQWMKDKGEQNKPLIISEYGILWPNWLLDDYVPNPTTRVSHFMTQTFDLFLYETYPDVGYPEDGYRLVQGWAWYSLSETYYNGKLFNPANGQLTTLGHTYANYTAALSDTPYADLTIYYSATLDTSPLQNIALGNPYETTSVTLPIWVHITNLGKLPVNDVAVAAYLPRPVTSTISVPARYTADVTPFLAASIVLTQPTRYDFDPNLLIVVDPENTVNDPRPWNNTMTVTIPTTIDARPDLVISMTAWSVRSADSLSGVLSITLTVANEGVWPAPSVSGTLSLSNAQGSLLLSSQRFSIPDLEFGEQVIITEELTLPSPVSALYCLVLEADSDNKVDEPNEGNNRLEVTVDIRPDLLISIADWSIQQSGAADDTLSITLTVSNQGLWSAQPVSGTRYLSNTHGTLLLPTHRFPIPAIDPGEQVIITQEVTLPVLDEDFYRLALDADSDKILDEQSENNNRVEVMIPIVVTVMLDPGATSVLTSTSSHMTFLFPAGTVATTTKMCFTPLWPSELPPGSLLEFAAFQLAVCQGGQPVSSTLLLPVTVTWRYTDTDVVGLDENGLDLYYWMESNRWRRISCPAKQRWPDENRLTTCVQQLGEYVFGYAYELFIPIVMSNVEGNSSEAYLEIQSEIQEAQWSEPDLFPGLPLRLPPWATPPAPH